MTDTDKLKRLAEELRDVASGKNEHGYLFVSRSEAEALLALVAENERLKADLEDAFYMHEDGGYYAVPYRPDGDS